MESPRIRLLLRYKQLLREGASPATLQDGLPLPGSHLEDQGPLSHQTQHAEPTKISQSLIEVEEKLNF